MCKLLSLTMILILCALPAYGSDLQQEFYKKYFGKNFKGWKGVVFVCSYKKETVLLNKICQRGITDIKLLAASHSIPLYVAKDNGTSEASFQSGIKDFLILEYQLSSSQDNPTGSLLGVHGRLSFNIFFSFAVEDNAKPNDIDSFPRSGDLEVWGRTVIASGTYPEIVSPFSDSAETLLKKFFTLYLTYRDP